MYTGIQTGFLSVVFEVTGILPRKKPIAMRLLSQGTCINLGRLSIEPVPNIETDKTAYEPRILVTLYEFTLNRLRHFNKIRLHT